MRKPLPKLRGLLAATALMLAAGAFAQENTITISASDISSTNATVNFKPSNDDLKYLTNVVLKSEFETRGGTEGVIDWQINMWKQYGQEYELDWKYWISDAMDCWGEFDEQLSYYTYYQPVAGATYVAYAFALDAEGEVLMPATAYEFQTSAAVPGENTFTVSVEEITDPGSPDGRLLGKIKVTPSIDTDKYMMCCFLKTNVEKYDLQTTTGQEEFIGQEMFYYKNDNNQAEGVHVFDVTLLKPGQQYVAVVLGLDADGANSTALTTYEFTAETKGIEVEGTLTLNVTDITPMNCRIQITPSNPEILYYYDVTTPDIIEMKGGVDAIPEKLIIDWWKYLASLYGDGTTWQEFIPLQTITGDFDAMAADLIEEGELSDIYWNRDWVLYAVGFDLDGNVVTEPAVFEFHTPDVEKVDMSFEFDFLGKEFDNNWPNQKYFKASVLVTPSNDTDTYRVNAMPVKYIDQYEDLDDEDQFFDCVTRQFLPSASIEFTDALQLDIPGMRIADIISGELINYYVLAMGWNEGPTTELYKYQFNYDTQAGLSLQLVETPDVIVSDGIIYVTGNCDSAKVYDTTGRLRGALNGAGNFSLPSGVYVVHVLAGDQTITRKVALR